MTASENIHRLHLAHTASQKTKSYVVQVLLSIFLPPPQIRFYNKP